VVIGTEVIGTEAGLADPMAILGTAVVRRWDRWDFVVEGRRTWVAAAAPLGWNLEGAGRRT